MFGDLFQPMHLLIIAIVLLVLFGAKRLPELGKGLGEGLKGFREGIRGITDPVPAQPVQQAVVNAAPQSTAQSKTNYRCPSCKNMFTANAPNPNAADEKGFCPECGASFEKKAALV